METGRSSIGMIAKGNVAGGRIRKFVAAQDQRRSDDQRRGPRLVHDRPVIPGTRRALLVIPQAIVMMHRTDSYAHYQVEQANRCCNDTYHSEALKANHAL